MLNFKADFNRDLVPVSFLEKASEWYTENLNWWKVFRIGIGIYLTFVLTFLSISALVYDFWIDEEFPVINYIFFRWLPLLLMMFFVLFLNFSKHYFSLKKNVVIKYLKKEIFEIENITKVSSIEEYNEKLWASFEISKRKNLLINHFCSLSLQNQEKYQDKFLDLLNEMDERFVTYQSVPLLLQPNILQSVSDGQKVDLIYLHQLFAMKRVLQSISD